MKDDFVIMGFIFIFLRWKSIPRGKKKKPAVCPKWLLILSKQSV